MRTYPLAEESPRENIANCLMLITECGVHVGDSHGRPKVVYDRETVERMQARLQRALGIV